MGIVSTKISSQHRSAGKRLGRLLAHNQEDLSAVDVSHYFQGYRGPPEGAELILSEYPVQYDRRSLDDDYYGKGYPTLAAILRAYAREPSPWESILRALIRRGADLHARVRRHRREIIELDIHAMWPVPVRH